MALNTDVNTADMSIIDTDAADVSIMDTDSDVSIMDVAELM